MLSRTVARYGAGGTLRGPSGMIVYGDKMTNVTLWERIQSNFASANMCLLAQTRDKFGTTTGPLSYWSGYQTWFYWEHGYTPLFQIKAPKLAGHEYERESGFDLHNTIFKTAFIGCIVGTILILKEIYSAGTCPPQRAVTAISDTIAVLKYYVRNEATIGWVPQQRWLESAGFPDDSEQPFDAS